MKTILITGSSSGIGKAITENLLAVGHRVIGIARDHNKFNPQHKNYITYTIDLADISQLDNQFKKILKNHNEIDTLIANAGYGYFAEVEQFSIAQMQNILHVNFLSQAILAKTFLPQLKTKEQGKIIFIGSECALNGYKKASMYCASKFALRGFAQSLRKESANANVAITMINPGVVDTDFFNELNFQPGDDRSNAIQPEQIAETIKLLIDMDNNCVVEEINLQPMKKVVKKKEGRESKGAEPIATLSTTVIPSE